MEKFDWRKAKELEKTYRANWNIRKLADINIEFCEKFGSGHTYSTRLPKACFYLGRLNAIDELRAFLERNQKHFFFGGSGTLELAQKCAVYGNGYENLPNSIKEEIRAYFSNPKYAELFKEMMFDYELYIEDVEPFDFSRRNIRDSEFSNDLIQNTARYILDFDEVHYYDKSKNDIVEIIDFEDSISGVHFILNITHTTNKRVDSVVELILKKLSIKIENHKENVIEMLLGKEDAKYADGVSFNGGFIIEIAKYLYDKRLVPNKSESEIESEISILLALDFLQFVNRK